MLTWEAKKEAIFEMPVGIRMRRDARDAKDDRDRAFERRDARRLARGARATLMRAFFDTDD